MTHASTEALFARYRETGDAGALALVFDRLAPQLLLVAAHLVNGDLAEDLVQATFLDAIRHGERWDRSRPLAPWLVGLLGNHVREARRQQQRVPDAKRLESRRGERPDQAAEASECLAAVHAAVEKLPRHYRQVLSLRLVHGLELQQIAHSLDAPLGTVKVRLHRGMALLRRALPAGLASTLAVLLSPTRGLAAVRQVVLTHAGTAVGAASAVGILLGGMVMMKQLLVGVVAVVLLAGTWWAFESTAVPAPARTETPGSVVAATTSTAPAEPPAQTPASPVPAAIPNEPAVREPAPTTGTLTVQVRWASDHTPAPDIDVRAFAKALGTWTNGRSDRSGKVVFAALIPASYRLVDARGAVPRALAVDVGAGDELTCELEIGGDVRLDVVVVDEAEQPQPEAEVWCVDSNAYGRTATCIGRTDALGRFRHHGLPLASMWARKPGLQPSLGHEFASLRPEDVPGEPIDVRLVLGPAGCVVLGSVVDPQGRAIAGAYVAIACEDSLKTGAQRMELTATTDGNGRFRCDEVPAGERYLVADAAGLAPACTRITTAPTEPVTVAVALCVGATLSGRVSDADGRPLADVQVTTGRNRYLPGLRLPWGSSRTVRTDAEGHYHIEAILPGEMQAAVATQPRVERTFTFADGELQTWDVTKEPERSITGAIVDAQDAPLAGWSIRTMASRGRGGNQPMGRSNAEGRFRITGLEDDTYRLFVFAPMAEVSGQFRPGAAAMVPRAVVESARPSPDELTIRVDEAAMASGWIEGSIAMPEGLRAKAELSLYAKALRGGGFSVPQERLEAGQTTFRIGPLPPGEYDLLCDIEGRGRLAHEGLRLAPDQTLQLPPFAADAQRPLHVVLHHADGRPASGATVKLRQTFEPCAETEPGRYASRPIAADAYDVLVHGPDFALDSFTVSFAGQGEAFEHTVVAASAVQLCMKPAVARERWVGAMQLRLRDATGTELVRDLIQIDGKQDFVWPIGLVPGTYQFNCHCFGDGSASTTFVVGSSPLRVDVQLEK